MIGKAIVFVIFALVFGALGQTQTRNSKMNEEISLKLKQKTIVQPGKLALEFVAVTEDSRCPEGVNCIWAGNAKINLQVTWPNQEVRVVELNTEVEPQTVSCQNYRIRLVRLEPNRKADVEIDPESYVAVLVVEKQ